MLQVIGVDSLDQLIDQTIPEHIRRETTLELPAAESEATFLDRLKSVAAKNKVFKSFIGMGYYDCHVPPVILRTVLENPSWYTPYTPYQAEISQGRLEALLNFQTMVTDLTGMEIANASLLDEATAAAEAMTMLYRLQTRKKKGVNTFFVSQECYPQTLEVLRGRAKPLGIELVVGEISTCQFDDQIYGAFAQYPDGYGCIQNLESFIQAAHESGALVAVATDLLALTLLKPPGEMGADIVFGNAQRMGIPLGLGGPHAAFFATRKEFAREIPGRIIGISVDVHGKKGYRMALQTREQHIRREKAKSNICTAQALLANMAGMYAVYHGPEGLEAIADRIYWLTKILDRELKKLGLNQSNDYYFDTLKIELEPNSSELLSKIKHEACKAEMNFRYIKESCIGISLDETATRNDVQRIVEIFSRAQGSGFPDSDFWNNEIRGTESIPKSLKRKTPFLTHSVFNEHRSETEMMRYAKHLERKDIGLDISMIPLGSCTMKLNAAAEMIPITWPEFSKLHPFIPEDQKTGFLDVFEDLCFSLCDITEFSQVSLQPNSGAQGEYAGLMVIKSFHEDHGENQRNVVLIPSSAHGTNPASAAMAGMNVVVTLCDERGYTDLNDLKEKADKHKETLSSLMITYPSTLGVFEEHIKEICDTIHKHGGQVYLDGANLNAQVGLTSPARVGADVCHINLHKTFSIPHGGGGPGMGPIAVAKHLVPYLPGHPTVKTGGEKAIHPVSAAPWGSASILLISYAYIRLLGKEGVTEATKHAILNANYIKARLEKDYGVLYTGASGRVAHELIFDLRTLKKKSGITEEDVAKRLIDYGFHAPTVSWPIPGTMMIEPTESESKQELDRFCDALIAIREEIQEVIDGDADPENNVLKNAPHTATTIAADNWPHSYSREKAVYPLPFVKEKKFWPSIGRINSAQGDRRLICKR